MLALLALGGTGVGGWYFYARSHTTRPDLILHTVKKEKLQITITERGSLEAADNTFFSCQVKAKAAGAAATSIRWVIDNGSIVKKGDKILELDDSALKDQLTTQQIEFDKAEEAYLKAQLTLSIDQFKNEAAVGTAQTNLEVAKITLKEYEEGLYVQTRVDLKNKLDMAVSDRFMWSERATWSDRMSQPGRQYVTVSQAEADAARHKTSDLTVTNLETQLRVLDELTKAKNVVDLKGKIDEAQRQVKLAQVTLEKTLALDDASVRSAYDQFQKQQTKLNDIIKEIDSALIRAPRDGMVVYYVEERARWNSNAGAIAQGEQVKEGAKLLAVPDLSQLVVNARVHEAMVPKVRDDIIKNTGFSEAVNTAMLFTPDPFSSLLGYIAFDSDMQTSFANEHADVERRQERRGLDAIVRVNAFQNRPLKAHVKSVAPVASQTDFFSSDVKVYQTYIAIDDENLEGLKPGMDTVVTIFVDSTPEPVVTVPLQALLGGVEMADKRRCFVMVDGHPEMREITLGKFNETLAEVKEGLNEGDVVVLTPSKLLSDKEKAEYGVSSASEQGGRGGPGGGKGAKGGFGGKGKGKGGYPGMKGGQDGMPGGGMQGGGRRGGGKGLGGQRSQGGAPTGSKAPANP